MNPLAANAPVRVGIIGVGQIGKRHLETYRKMDNVEIAGIADVNEAEARRVAGLYTIPYVTTHFRDLLERDDIAAVDVCLHNNFHMPVTVAALEAGKHVFCEKPMAGSYADAKCMFDTAQATGRRLSIQLVTLFERETKAAKELIAGGHLGRIYHARSAGHRRRGRPYVDGYGAPTFVQKQTSAGGALYDMGVYHIASMLWLLGNPRVLRITGKTYQELDMDATRRGASGYSVEELGLGWVRLENQLTLDIVEAWAVHLNSFDGSIVLGNKAGLRLNPFGLYQTIGDIDFDATADLERYAYRLQSVRGQTDEYAGPQQHWIAALQGRVDLLPTAELALNTMLISEGIYLSDRLEREVSAEEVEAMSVSTAVGV